MLRAPEKLTSTRPKAESVRRSIGFKLRPRGPRPCVSRVVGSYVSPPHPILGMAGKPGHNEQKVHRIVSARAPAAVLPGDGEIFPTTPTPLRTPWWPRVSIPLRGLCECRGITLNFRDTQMTKGRPTRLLGEHTRRVLEEFGFEAQDIEPVPQDWRHQDRADCYTVIVARTQQDAIRSTLSASGLQYLWIASM